MWHKLADKTKNSNWNISSTNVAAQKFKRTCITVLNTLSHHVIKILMSWASSCIPHRHLPCVGRNLAKFVHFHKAQSSNICKVVVYKHIERNWPYDLYSEVKAQANSGTVQIIHKSTWFPIPGTMQSFMIRNNLLCQWPNPVVRREKAANPLLMSHYGATDCH